MRTTYTIFLISRQTYGIWFHVTNLIIYMVFLASLSIFIASFDHSDTAKHNIHNATSDADTTTVSSISDITYKVCIPPESTQFTLVRVPKNNHIKGSLGSILTPKRVIGSLLTPADALKSLDLPMFRA